MLNLEKLKNSKIARNWLILLFIQLFNMALAFAYFPFFLSVLGPEEFGKLATFISLCQILIIFTDYGLALYGQKIVSESADDKNKLLNVFISVTAIRLLLCVLAFAVASALLLLFLGPDDFDFKLFSCCYLATVSNALYFQWFMQGLQSFVRIAIVQVLSRIAIFGLIILFVRDSSDYYLAGLLQSSPLLLAAIIGLPDLMQYFSGIKKTLPSWSDLRSQLHAGRNTFLSTALNALYTSSGTFLIGTFYSAKSAGVYFLAEKIIRSVQALHAPMVHASIAYSTQLFFHHEEKFYKFVKKQTMLIGSIFLIASITILLLNGVIQDLFFHDESGKLKTYLIYMAFIPTFAALSGCIGYLVLMPQNRMGYFVLSQLIAFFANSVLFYPIITMFGVDGVALLTMSVEILAFLSLLPHILAKRRAVIAESSM